MDYSLDIFKDYIDCYEKMARDTLNGTLKEDTKNFRLNKLVEFIGNCESYKVLDIGSSEGLLLNLLNADYKIAYDISLTYLKVAKETYNLNTILGNAELLPFKDKTFDLIICSDILEHVFFPEKTVEESKRILKDNGKFIIVVPWKENLSKYEIYNGIYNFTHLRSFNHKSTKKLLEGWKIKKMQGCMPKYIIISPLFGRLRIPKLNKLINRIITETVRLKTYPGPEHMMIEVEKVIK